MTIWLLAILLLACVAGLGLRQGGIRVGFSLIGIILGALLSPALGRLLKPLLLATGLKNPILIWLLGPLIVFILFSAVFKIAGLMVHQKVDVYYKYKAGDLRLALWERLNQRIGLALGLLNGFVYLVLISFIIYAFSYWTIQMTTSETDPKPVRMLNRLGQDLQSTGFAKVAKSIDKLPEAYYDAADVAGVLYNTPLLEARLARYPALLSIAERPEFQDLANDKDFSELRLQRKPIRDVLDYPKVKAILDNMDLTKLIWSTLTPDLKDLQNYLLTLRSAKYDSERILGRWNFDVRSAIAAYRKVKPNIPSTEMARIRKAIDGLFARASIVAMPDHKALLKNLAQLKVVPSATPAVGQVAQGQWANLGGKYQFTFSLEGREQQVPATLEGDRLTLSNEGTDLVLLRED
jgi:hypothetical protein